jgi:hypothetical protein
LLSNDTKQQEQLAGKQQASKRKQEARRSKQEE